MVDINKLIELIQRRLPDVKITRSPHNYKAQGFFGPNKNRYFRNGGIETFGIELNGVKIKLIIKSAYNIDNHDKEIDFIEAAVNREHTKMYEFNELVNDRSKRKLFCDELKHLSISKDDLFKNMPYSDIAKALKMEKINTMDPTRTFTALYSKDKMAYGNAFPYSDMFTYDSKLTSLLKKVCKKHSIMVDIKRVWVNDTDKNLLLLSTPGFHFLTTVDDLSKDLAIKTGK